MDLFQFIFVAYRQHGPCPVDPVIYLLNMDTQDAQDQQDETLRTACNLMTVSYCLN